MEATFLLLQLVFCWKHSHGDQFCIRNPTFGLQQCGFQEVAAAQGVGVLQVSESSNHLPNYGFFISGSQVQCCILKLNSSVVASYFSAVLIVENIATLCGSGMCYEKLSLKPPLDNPSIIFVVVVQSN